MIFFAEMSMIADDVLQLSDVNDFFKDVNNIQIEIV